MTDRDGRMNSPEGGHSVRAMHILLVVVLAIAVIGFFVGVDYGVPHPHVSTLRPEIETRPDAGVVPALSYEAIGETDVSANRDWRSDLARLPRPEVDLFAEVSLDPELKRRSLAQRAELRAYNGAPPTIPHATDQMSDANCIACHTESLRIGDRLSPILPHAELRNCQQCHVSAGYVPFEGDGLAAPSTFRGIDAPFQGERAWVGAPPTIPHTTFMRQNCLACHGPTADPGLRTTHPWRQSCTQCHAPSAELEQRAFTASAFLPPPEVPGDGR